MANKLAELKSAIGAGGRINKYRINLSIPAGVPTVSNLGVADALCKSASFPSMTVSPIEVFNQGRKLIIPGDTSYENSWALTFYNTEDHALRRDMIAWQRAIDNFQNNTHTGNPGALMTEMSVEQLDSAGNPTAKYTFNNVWPTEVAGIDLADDADGGISDLSVTFSFSDWIPEAYAAATANDIA